MMEMWVYGDGKEENAVLRRYLDWSQADMLNINIMLIGLSGGAVSGT